MTGGDLRYSWRSLRATPGFAAVVIVTLAIGIGANSAIFSVVHAMLLRPLPFGDPERLVRVYHTYPFVPDGIEGLSPADFFALRNETRAFEAVGTYRVSPDGFAFSSGDRPEMVYGTYVGPDFFRALGVAPLAGRTFERDDENPSSPFRIVISYDFWQRRLSGDPGVAGRSLNLAGLSAPVVGVMPRGFWFPRSDRSELWAIERMSPPNRQGPWFFQAVGRLRPGVSTAQAQDDLNAAARAVQQRFPQRTADWTLVTRPFRRQLIGDMGPALLLLLAAAALVLVIACVNVTNLMLARATAREREIAVRVALGASRRRIVGQLLTEALLLASAGVAVGLVIARVGVTVILALTPDNLQILHDANVTTDWPVVGVAVALAIACACVFAVAPAIGTTAWQMASLIASARSTETAARRRMRGALVVAEIALSVMLLVCAGLVTRSLLALQRAETGIGSTRVLTAMVTVPPGYIARAQNRRAVDQFFDRLLASVRAQPGVEAAAIADGLPPAGPVGASNFIVEGQPMPNGQAEPIGEFVNVDGDYFRVFGIPLLRGRTFDGRDAPGSPNTVAINETLARRFFPGADPIGRQLRVGGDWVATIVGVAGNVKYGGLDASGELTMYGAASGGSPRTMSLVVRTAADPLSVVPALRAALAQIDPEVPLGRTRSLDQLISESVVRPRFRTTLLSLFAIAALVLAAIGIYGVMAYSVSRRTRELGIRLALGAQRRDVIAMLVGEGMTLAAGGAAIGIVAALALTRVMSGLLFGITATDPSTFATVAALLIAVALVACWLPARRATRVDPVLALRAE